MVGAQLQKSTTRQESRTAARREWQTIWYLESVKLAITSRIRVSTAQSWDMIILVEMPPTFKGPQVHTRP